ncbi:hypothetical protein, partial [Streptomyces sp. NRRL F-5135]|uniref:hypothetical protein n=1 Tax=Streptomyces sp. NRRL F-5135 TaxID=1463858 RepID=UPI00055B2452
MTSVEKSDEKSVEKSAFELDEGPALRPVAGPDVSGLVSGRDEAGELDGESDGEVGGDDEGGGGRYGTCDPLVLVKSFVLLKLFVPLTLFVLPGVRVLRSGGPDSASEPRVGSVFSVSEDEYAGGGGEYGGGGGVLRPLPIPSGRSDETVV